MWKAGYAFGFIALTLGRQQLYTESTLIAYLPLSHERSRGMFFSVTRLWLVVLAANLVGAFLFALAVSYPESVRPALHEAFRKIGLEAASHAPFAAFVKGIFGGWSIALMIWLLPAAQTARVTVMFMLTWLLGVAGFTHIIAGSVDVFYVVIAGEVSWWTYLVNFGVPTLAGNTIGGMLLVAALNRSHATNAAGE